ncbi:MAG: hypothetical protein HXS51_12575 [Theionarchaea archaeon]|nr:hypothetical protein [Theionarchaea archaeon]
MTKPAKGSVVAAQGNVSPARLQAELAGEAKAILISKGISDTVASRASEEIINWAFCVLIGGIPVGSFSAKPVKVVDSTMQPIDLEP